MMLRIWLPDAFRHLVPLKNVKFDFIGSENASWQIWLQTEIG